MSQQIYHLILNQSKLEGKLRPIPAFTSSHEIDHGEDNGVVLMENQLSMKPDNVEINNIEIDYEDDEGEVEENLVVIATHSNSSANH